MNITSSLTSQWPVVALLVLLIGPMLAFIVRLYDQRITELKGGYEKQLAEKQADHEREVADLRERLRSEEGETNAWRSVAFAGTVIAEKAASVADQAGRTAPPPEGAKPGALTQAARRIIGKRVGP